MGKQETLFPLPTTSPRVSKRKSSSLDKIKVNHVLAKSRYYLHRRLDRTKFTYDGATRIIDSKYESLEDMPAKQQKYIRQLIDLGYNVQFKVLGQAELDALIRIEAPPEEFSKWQQPAL